MAKLVISKTQDVGEIRFFLTLVNDNGELVLRSVDSVEDRVASATAKEIAHDKGRSVWIVEKVGDTFKLRFSKDLKLLFDILFKPELAQADKAAEEAAEYVRKLLEAGASIEWDPVDSDPAFQAKQEDTTPPRGHPGS